MQLFADEKIEFAGQPVGVIVATTHAIANVAANEVRVTYANVDLNKTVLTIEDCIVSNDETRLMQTVDYPAKSKGGQNKLALEIYTTASNLTKSLSGILNPLFPCSRASRISYSLHCFF